MKNSRRFKAIIPGGSSVNVLTEAALDAEASFDGLVKAGSMLGSAAVMVMDETTDMVWVAENLTHFYKHESCGKCTPCREGSDWMHKILQKILRGEGAMRDLDLLLSVANNIGGKTLCPFGDAEIAPVVSTLQHFRDEYEHYIREGRSKLPRADWMPASIAGAHAH
jgi:NADH-quinone oxidoreductase subunit F